MIDKIYIRHKMTRWDGVQLELAMADGTTEKVSLKDFGALGEGFMEVFYDLETFKKVFPDEHPLVIQVN